MFKKFLFHFFNTHAVYFSITFLFAMMILIYISIRSYQQSQINSFKIIYYKWKIIGPKINRINSFFDMLASMTVQSLKVFLIHKLGDELVPERENQAIWGYHYYWTICTITWHRDACRKDKRVHIWKSQLSASPVMKK